MFMGVPTMYSYMLATYDQMSDKDKQRAQDSASKLRLTVSGSAACPLPVMERWHQLSGQLFLLVLFIQEHSHTLGAFLCQIRNVDP